MINNTQEQKSVNPEENECESTPENLENDQKRDLDLDKNNASYGPEHGFPGLPGQRYVLEKREGKQREQEDNNSQPLSFIKCPYNCGFQNIYQESIDHHIRYKHDLQKSNRLGKSMSNEQ